MAALNARLREEGHDLLSSYIIRPDPLDPRLSQEVEAIDQTGGKIKTRVVVERPLTLYLNAQEILSKDISAWQCKITRTPLHRIDDLPIS